MSDYICTVCISQAGLECWIAVLQKEQRVHTEMQPSLIDPLGPDVCFVPQLLGT